MNTISAVVLTKNEGQYIENCLRLLSFADEIIVVDDSSTDDTVEKAKKFKARICHHVKTDFADARNFAAKQVEGEWIFYVDTDERVTKDLRNEVINAIKSTDCSAFAIPRENILLGSVGLSETFWPDYQIRLLKRLDLKGWSGAVHEVPLFSGKLGKLANPLIHLAHRDLDQMMAKSLDWSWIEAKLNLNNRADKVNGFKMFWGFLRGFVGLAKKGVLFKGSEGWIEAIMAGVSKFLTYERIWQLQQRESLTHTYLKLDEKITKENEA